MFFWRFMLNQFLERRHRETVAHYDINSARKIIAAFTLGLFRIKWIESEWQMSLTSHDALITRVIGNCNLYIILYDCF